MGSVISKAANGVGVVLGNAFVAPIKSVFGGSCEGVCSGTWDITCFIEHLCVSNLVKLLMVLVLCYITLLFFYLMFKVGIFQCIGRSLCKMCWAACETYWFALEDITCFLWHKLKNTKRVNRRRRFRDIEVGYSSSDESKSLDKYWSLNVNRKRKSNREGRKQRLQNSLYPLRQSYKDGYVSHSRHGRHHVRLKTREVSVHAKGRYRGARNSRQLQMRKVSNLRREAAMFKRRRFR
ncbi:hypothetical protein L1049_003828 [Liquidambar formosana]|uniref:Uncharacterized protein n=1 Tax=Liquidambar formosana TaxID=63359 RepID=A0AAP0RQW2_LIQFO